MASTLVEPEIRIQQSTEATWLYVLFFISGIPAILYQIVWQRALFSLYGINIESVTIVVSAFMLGLGLGSLLGGVLSRKRSLSPVLLFASAEIGTAIFALRSLPLFRVVAEHTRSAPVWLIGVISFLLVVFPTILMGSTLPLLIEQLVRSSKKVGSAVAALYFANTLGSGGGCIVVVPLLMSKFGQTGTIRCAALMNATVGIVALIKLLGTLRQSGVPVFEGLVRKQRTEDEADANDALMPFTLALICSAFFGFAALSYEIIWYRLLAFALVDTASTFSSLLGSYLIGIAFGSHLAEKYVERHSIKDSIGTIALVILASSVVSFSISPIAAMALKVTSISSQGTLLATFIFLLLICHATILFGALFPLLAHASVSLRNAGARSSYLYAANIAGSTLGVLLTGFVLMDRLSLFQIGSVLLLGGVACALSVFLASESRSRGRRSLFLIYCCIGIIAVIASRSVFAQMYDRLLFKDLYPEMHFSEVIERRSGTVAVTPDGTVFGDGIYDGRFNTDLFNESNIIFRPYTISAFHANPANVLMIGLGSGSWAQVVANDPEVQNLTVVEINPAYSETIAKHPATSSLLHNPKVAIVIDDGRRWLQRHPEAIFDAVVMNTSFHWRNHSSNLLSTEFLQIVHSHLSAKGVFFYNTTGSDDVIATALEAYPYALRISTCLAVSDSPLALDRNHWKSVLLRYEIDGKRIVDSADPGQLSKLDQIVNIREAPGAGDLFSIESNDQLRSRLAKRKSLIITDDNMGLEWQ